MEIYLKEIRKFQPLSKWEEKELIKKAKAGDKVAYNDLIKCNLKFVISVAKKYQNQGLDLDELVAEGNIGLIKAYEKFDIKKDVKFITYAVWWIRQSILNAIHENAKTIRLPINRISNLTKISKLKAELEQEMGREVDIDELAATIDDPDILEDIKYHYTVIDIDKEYTENNQDLNNVLEDKLAPSPALDLELVLDELNEIFKELTPREQHIICKYYGIKNTRAFTLKEIGGDHNLTRERIRQIKEKVLQKLRKKSIKEKLVEYL